MISCRIKITKDWFTLSKVPADGNCLFHAVRAQIDLPVKHLRHLVFEELQKPRYEPMIPKPPRDCNFSWNGPYGDIAPMALAQALRVSIFIAQPNGIAYFMHPDQGRTHSPIYLFLCDGHYSVLEPREPLLRWEDEFYG